MKPKPKLKALTLAFGLALGVIASAQAADQKLNILELDQNRSWQRMVPIFRFYGPLESLFEKT